MRKRNKILFLHFLSNALVPVIFDEKIDWMMKEREVKRYESFATFEDD